MSVHLLNELPDAARLEDTSLKNLMGKHYKAGTHCSQLTFDDAHYTASKLDQWTQHCTAWGLHKHPDGWAVYDLTNTEVTAGVNTLEKQHCSKVR